MSIQVPRLAHVYQTSYIEIDPYIKIYIPDIDFTYQMIIKTGLIIIGSILNPDLLVII